MLAVIQELVGSGLEGSGSQRSASRSSQGTSQDLESAVELGGCPVAGGHDDHPRGEELLHEALEDHRVPCKMSVVWWHFLAQFSSILF